MKDRGARPCPNCRAAKIYAARLDRIPPRYREARLATLRPQTPWQQAVLPPVQADPGGNWVFDGDSGSGKTYLAYAVLRHAIEAGRPVWAGTLDDWFAAQQEHALGRSSFSATPSRLRVRGERWTLLLDEVAGDRSTDLRDTPFRREALHQLMGACYDYEHQVIATGNGLFAEWQEKWGWRTMRRLLVDDELPRHLNGGWRTLK